MRRILVEQARRKAAAKHGGGQKRLDADEVDIPIAALSEDVLALDEALERLQRRDKRKADVVMLRYFAGLTTEETARMLRISIRTTEREWRFARALLYRDLFRESPD
jgi:RNA polymerase sigma factor (TIGR02999 family)